MEDVLTRLMEDLAGRVYGLMHFRFILQPFMAIFFAVRDARRDARDGRVPYNWAMLTDKGHRRGLLRSGWKSVGKIIVLALILDAIYQYIELGRFYPGEAVLVAFALAIVPYLLIRGPLNRLLRRMKLEESHEQRGSKDA